MLGQKEVREIATKYAIEVRNILTPEKVILFGSYVNGNPHEWSDIDIAVLVNDVSDENWHDIWASLCGLTWKDTFIDVEPHLMDETQDPSGFVEHVIKTGEVIYSR